MPFYSRTIDILEHYNPSGKAHWTIVFISFPEFPHVHDHVLKKFHGDSEIFFVNDRLKGDKREKWLNCDRVFRDTWKKIRNKTKGENILFLEGDVFVNMRIPDIPISGMIGWNVHTYKDHPDWYWWEKITSAHLKLFDLQTKEDCLYCAPSAICGFRRELLDEMIKEKYDAAYATSMISEFRNPNVVLKAGYPLESFKDWSGDLTKFSIIKYKPFDKKQENRLHEFPGLFHPVKVRLI